MDICKLRVGGWEHELNGLKLCTLASKSNVLRTLTFHLRKVGQVVWDGPATERSKCCRHADKDFVVPCCIHHPSIWPNLAPTAKLRQEAEHP